MEDQVIQADLEEVWGILEVLMAVHVEDQVIQEVLMVVQVELEEVQDVLEVLMVVHMEDQVIQADLKEVRGIPARSNAASHGALSHSGDSHGNSGRSRSQETHFYEIDEVVLVAPPSRRGSDVVFVIMYDVDLSRIGDGVEIYIHGRVGNVKRLGFGMVEDEDLDEVE
ncbi:hypothetical protein U1Q18_051016 [Sarracenia purpurea var. burkii]